MCYHQNVIVEPVAWAGATWRHQNVNTDHNNSGRATRHVQHLNTTQSSSCSGLPAARPCAMRFNVFPKQFTRKCPRPNPNPEE